MADVRPETDVESFGDDFPVAKPDDPRFRRSSALAVLHIEQGPAALPSEGKNVDRPAYHVIIIAISAEILKPKQLRGQVMSNVREPKVQPIPILSLRPTQMTV